MKKEEAGVTRQMPEMPKEDGGGRLHPVFDNDDVYNAVYDLDRLRVRENGWCSWWRSRYDGHWHLGSDMEKKGAAVCGASHMGGSSLIVDDDLTISPKCVACENYDKLYIIAMRLLGISGTMKGDEMMVELHVSMSKKLETHLGLDHPDRRRHIAGVVKHYRSIAKKRKKKSDFLQSAYHPHE